MEQVVQGPDPTTYKGIIIAMGVFIGSLILWIKALLKENKETTDARIADLKEQNKVVSRRDTPPAFPRQEGR